MVVVSCCCRSSSSTIGDTESGLTDAKCHRRMFVGVYRSRSVNGVCRILLPRRDLSGGERSTGLRERAGLGH